MRLYHATPRSNIESIKATGIDPSYSQGKIIAVWMHTKSRREWAILHTQRRHKTDDIIVIEIEVPRDKLTRRGKGLWSCPEIVADFRSFTDAEEFSKSPIVDN